MPFYPSKPPGYFGWARNFDLRECTGILSIRCSQRRVPRWRPPQRLPEATRKAAFGGGARAGRCTMQQPKNHVPEAAFKPADFFPVFSILFSLFSVCPYFPLFLHYSPFPVFFPFSSIPVFFVSRRSSVTASQESVASLENPRYSNKCRLSSVILTC